MRTNLEILKDIKERRNYFEVKYRHFAENYVQEGTTKDFNEQGKYYRLMIEMDDIIEFIESGELEEER